MRKGLVLFEYVCYLALTILLSILIARFSSNIIRLVQKEGGHAAALMRMHAAGILLGRIVATAPSEESNWMFTRSESMLVWRDGMGSGDRPHIGLLFEKNKIWVCRGMFDAIKKIWVTALRQVIAYDIARCKFSCNWYKPHSKLGKRISHVSVLLSAKSSPEQRDATDFELVLPVFSGVFRVR